MTILTTNIFKYNSCGKGYVFIWDDNARAMGVTQTDQLLADVDDEANEKPIAYSAHHISENTVFISIGVYWPHHSDEHGRKGIYYWHGIYCSLTDMNSKNMIEVSIVVCQLPYKIRQDLQDYSGFTGFLWIGYTALLSC